MINMLHVVKEQYFLASHSGLELLFVWFLILFLLAKNRRNCPEKNMLSYLLGLLAILWFPVSAYYFMGLHTEETNYYKLFFLLPVVVVISIFFTSIYMRLEKKSAKMILTVGLVFIMFSNTTVVPNFSCVKLRGNLRGFDADAITISHVLEQRGATKVLAVQSYEKTAIQGDSDIKFLTEPVSVMNQNGGPTTGEQKAVVEMLSWADQYLNDGDDMTSPAKPYRMVAEGYGIEYIVLDDPYNDVEYMTANGYEMIAEYGQYHAYYKKRTGWIITEYASESGNQSMVYTLEDAEGHLIIVDGGWTQDKEQVLEQIANHGNHVDAWILTHPDPDHIGAFNAIFSDTEASAEIQVDSIYVPDVDYDTFAAQANWWDGLADYGTFLDITKDWNNVIEVKAGDRYQVLDLQVDFYNSYSNKVEGTDAINDGSLMFEISGTRDSMLFCADVGVRMSGKLIGQWGDALQATYIQMGHHGNGGLNEDFYRLVHPEVAFFDAPEWLFHPGEDTPYDSEEKAAIMESMRAKVYYYATTPNKVPLR